MASAYNDKEVATMREMYMANPCSEVVGRLSVLLNKPKRSIISKLSKEGVYVVKGYRSKTGELPITKLQLVRRIEGALDIKLPGLDKAPKSTLQLLSDTTVDMTTALEDTVDALSDTIELKAVRGEMGS